MPSVSGSVLGYMADNAQGAAYQEAMQQYLTEYRRYLEQEQRASDANAEAMKGFSGKNQNALNSYIQAMDGGHSGAVAAGSAKFTNDANGVQLPPGYQMPQTQAGSQQFANATTKYSPQLDAYKQVLSYRAGQGAGGTFDATQGAGLNRATGVNGSDANLYNTGASWQEAQRKRQWSLRAAQLQAQLGEQSQAASNLRLLGGVAGAGENAWMGGMSKQGAPTAGA